MAASKVPKHPCMASGQFDDPPLRCVKPEGHDGEHSTDRPWRGTGFGRAWGYDVVWPRAPRNEGDGR